VLLVPSRAESSVARLTIQLHSQSLDSRGDVLFTSSSLRPHSCSAPHNGTEPCAAGLQAQSQQASAHVFFCAPLSTDSKHSQVKRVALFAQASVADST
jgi:hypothetical protein